jgi:hypothetical protein
MSYLELIHNTYPDSFSKVQSLGILSQYKTQLTDNEYNAIWESLCSHALEGIYLNEKDIVLSIAQLRNEITLEEIVEMVKIS